MTGLQRALISFPVPGLFILLTLTSALAAPANATANKRSDFAWHSPSCRAERLHTGNGANYSTPDNTVFVDQAQARNVLRTSGAGRLEIRSLKGKPLTVHVFRPARFDARTGRLWFVMHGTGRNATRYLQQAAPLAERYQVLVLVPEFSRRDYPSGDAYTLGVVSNGRADAQAAGEGRWRSRLTMPYAEIERTFGAVRTALESEQPGYFIFGHSAGAQFVHRLLTFAYCPQVLGAVAANAGWYTLPATDEKLPPFPYSLRATPPEFHDTRPLLAAPLTLLLGTSDTQSNEEDPQLRGSPAAMMQGADRLARGRFYYQIGVRAARNSNANLGWTIQLVEGAGHEVADVIVPAAQRLFAPAPEATYHPIHAPPQRPQSVVQPRLP